MWYCIKNVNETRTLKNGITNIDTILINERGGQGSYLEVYDSTGSTDSSNLAAKIDITGCDSLLQYLPYGLELQNGLTYKTTGDPGNITISYR